MFVYKQGLFRHRSYWKFEEFFPFKITTYFPSFVSSAYDSCHHSPTVVEVNNPVYLNHDSSDTSERWYHSVTSLFIG
ncbi:uncharacterized protein LOC118766694 isoform X2 [Octopus sinensis]|uniref:Uncharacterized protein LOC118766694 isoform X2 n=1 Tax=Octopus sinensis TaxID=2607531 RepID=A0A7E6FEM1_9MOLL|nr:uncharacterized protein LOC118766694 isoform X2 [Octopus sinensis]